MSRHVTPFVDLELANADRQARGECVLFDVHGLWWSVPAELTIHQVNRAMLETLHDADLLPPTATPSSRITAPTLTCW